MLEIVVPAYNEEARLGATLRGLKAHVTSRESSLYGTRVEVIVVDNASRDRTAEVALRHDTVQMPVRVVRCDTPGKGAAVAAGVALTTGEFVAFMDADGATAFDALDEGVRLVRLGADFAIGSRGHCEADVSERHTSIRATGGAAFRALTDRIVPGIVDTQCGMKVMRGDSAREVFPNLTILGFTFDVELLAIAHRWSMRLVEFPVTWVDVPGSTFSPARHGLTSFVDLARVKWRLRRMAPQRLSPVMAFPRQAAVVGDPALDVTPPLAIGLTGEA